MYQQNETKKTEGYKHTMCTNEEEMHKLKAKYKNFILKEVENMLMLCCISNKIC